MNLGRPLGQLRVAAVREDDDAVALAARVVGLSAEEVRVQLNTAHGVALVGNALKAWPRSASALATKNVALARDAGLHAELLSITKASKQLVTRRLNEAHGRTLLKTVFWDYWPRQDEAPRSSDAIESTSVPALAGAEFETTISDLDHDDMTHDTEPPPPSIQVGALVSSRYDVRDHIGDGGFGTTWLAFDRLSQSNVVLKVPRPDAGDAIQQEFSLAFKLVHPNICQAFPERDDASGRHFLVMQHGGRDLRMVLRERGNRPLPLALALDVLVSVANALDYLHDRLLLHLDVTPANILLDDDGIVRLTDFGSSSRAREVSIGDGRTVLADKVTSLSPIWAAPEVLRQEPGRSRSDQFSLFCVFSCLLTGALPGAHGELRRPPFDALTPTQNAAVSRALSERPDDRFETCGEAARAVADDMRLVPKTVLVDSLDYFSHALLLRLKSPRLEKSGTERVGAVVKFGRSLEALLQATLLWMASVDGFDPDAELHRLYPKVTHDRASLGQMAHVIREHRGGAAAKRNEVAALVEDVSVEQTSAITRLITARNHVMHRNVPGETTARAAQDVIKLLQRMRAAAGWSEPG